MHSKSIDPWLEPLSPEMKEKLSKYLLPSLVKSIMAKQLSGEQHPVDAVKQVKPENAPIIPISSQEDTISSEVSALSIKDTAEGRRSRLLHDIFMDDQVDMYRTKDLENFLIVKHGIDVIKIDLSDKQKAIDELRYYFYSSDSGIHNDKDLKDAANILRSVCKREGKQIEQHPRIFRDGNLVYYNLGDAEGKRYVIIEPNKYSIHNGVEPRFKVNGSQAEQVIPVPGGNLNLLDKYINLPPDGILLIKTWIVSSIIPGYEQPLLVLDGQYASGKSTATRIIQSIVDPSNAGPLSKPNSRKDLIINLSLSHLVAFDNFSDVKQGLSDDLCTGISGGGFILRKLFTDKDIVILSYKRSIILNGMLPIDLRPDLLSRCISFYMEEVPKEKGIDREALTQQFEKEKPLILGAVFDIVSKVLGSIQTTPETPFVRMGDFMRIGTLIAETMQPGQGKIFQKAYQRNIEQVQLSISQRDPLLIALVTFMSRRTEVWEGNMSKLMEELESIASELRLDTRTSMWPGGSNILPDKLRRHASHLFKNHGIVISELQRSAIERKYRIEKQERKKQDN